MSFLLEKPLCSLFRNILSFVDKCCLWVVIFVVTDRLDIFRCFVIFFVVLFVVLFVVFFVVLCLSEMPKLGAGLWPEFFRWGGRRRASAGLGWQSCLGFASRQISKQVSLLLSSLFCFHFVCSGVFLAASFEGACCGIFRMKQSAELQIKKNFLLQSRRAETQKTLPPQTSRGPPSSMCASQWRGTWRSFHFHQTLNLTTTLLWTTLRLWWVGPWVCDWF